MDTEPSIDSKIVVMGSSGVGKTSLLYRYTQNRFDPSHTTSTSGAFFVTKKVYMHGMKVRLQLWDTAGQERFRSMAPMYYRGANAALLLYDITNKNTFYDIRGWLEELRKNSSPELIVYIVGAKADLANNRQVTMDLARLNLHNWFPPPTAPPKSPPPPPYVRPRFLSFPGLSTVSSGLRMSSARAGASTPSWVGATSRNGDATSPTWVGSPTRPRYMPNYDDTEDEDDENDTQDEEEEWGLSRGMELFEVSAKDDLGIQALFSHLITALIQKRDHIEHENELRRRDSVLLSSGKSDGDVQVDSDGEEEVTKERSSPRSWTGGCC
ncbi:ras-domain-containing protein [Fistulina hepatica ATCC 64428]|uniref:Ras-domain-containing protein n=1 Tax=Fistulina hepatica ATCC 64428 TaxID=1128425 RepID=A0A0D7A4H7_9AGAR|nr:ras-domain-containing protein [Fistulina hepatica ATCC 64428]